ncbi:aminotransferase class I and II [Zalerion maritima]|uniref:Aspartate aminotransferase n=1 Tax=Zalerion maritima TaxID=339359 RepID=A0AAD5RY27_9PEZI|nr:aminotransferase class I and II [Zalerion maritima]
MSPSSSSTSSSPSNNTNTSASILRIHNIASHMASVAPTSFPADQVPQAPEDPLFFLMRTYRADESPNKVDLGIGAYRDDDAKPWVLPVVKKSTYDSAPPASADEVLRSDPNLNHEYLPIAGLASFTSKAAELILGSDSPALAEERTTSFQTISGTGAVHLGAAFLAKFYRGNRTVYLPDPTWANHKQIFGNVGIPSATYPYFDKSTKGLDFEGMKAALSAAPEASIILLHPCAHNPTGVDPTLDQWKELADLVKQKKHFPFFDCAYQGFASGDLDKDAAAIRYFVAQGFEMLIAQSFAKNFGLYGERAGCFHAVTAPHADATSTIGRISSQLAIVQRSEISNPPIYGARVASTVLNDVALFSEWTENLKTMSGRIIAMRKDLREKLEALGTPGTWNHITDQIGMFSYTGLSEEQVLKLRSDAHIYMTKNGRISMAGLNTKNVNYVAKAFDKVNGNNTNQGYFGSNGRYKAIFSKYPSKPYREIIATKLDGFSNRRSTFEERKASILTAVEAEPDRVSPLSIFSNGVKSRFGFKTSTESSSLSNSETGTDSTSGSGNNSVEAKLKNINCFLL